MRNALYQGNATRLLNRLSKLDNFGRATGNAISSKHMKDKYVILRALCFYLLNQKELTDNKGKLVVYHSDMEELLGIGMQYFNTISRERLRTLEELFDSNMKKAYECMGVDGFRIPSSGKTKRPISMTLFETLFYYYTLFETNTNYEKMREGIKELLDDKEYLRSLQHSVDSSVNVNIRFGKVISKYAEIRSK